MRCQKDGFFGSFFGLVLFAARSDRPALALCSRSDAHDHPTDRASGPGQ
jgi:hypothetical protein